MAVIYVPRVGGGTLILNTGTIVATPPTLVVVATFRDGQQEATHRDGQQTATHRDGVVSAGGR